MIVPELPELLTAQETQVTADHLDHADWTLRALDSLVTRGFSTRQQRETILHELINRIQEDYNERHHTTWVITIIVFILILTISFLTSKYWQRPFLRIASQMSRRRPLEPVLPPRPKRRRMRSPKLPMISEEVTSAEWERQVKLSLLECSENIPLTPCQMDETDSGPSRSQQDSKATNTDAPVSAPGVSYSHPGRFQK